MGRGFSTSFSFLIPGPSAPQWPAFLLYAMHEQSWVLCVLFSNCIPICFLNCLKFQARTYNAFPYYLSHIYITYSVRVGIMKLCMWKYCMWATSFFRIYSALNAHFQTVFLQLDHCDVIEIGRGLSQYQIFTLLWSEKQQYLVIFIQWCYQANSSKFQTKYRCIVN